MQSLGLQKQLLSLRFKILDATFNRNFHDYRGYGKVRTYGIVWLIIAIFFKIALAFYVLKNFCENLFLALIVAAQHVLNSLL